MAALPPRRKLCPQPKLKKTNEVAKPERVVATSDQNVASAVAGMVVAAAVVAMNAAIVQKVARRAALSSAAKVAPTFAMKADQRPEATSAHNAVTSIAARNNAVTSAPIYEVNNGLRAKSHVSRVHRANLAKAAAKSDHAVNVANAMNGAVNSASPWTAQSKTLHWPTRPPWQQPWVMRERTQRKKPRAVNVAIAVVAPTGALSHVVSARTSVMPLQSKSLAWT